MGYEDLCIHLEGPDGSGKTTLFRGLTPRLGLTPIPTDNPPRTWEGCRARIAARTRPGLICDRSSGLVSELVYGPIIRGRTIIPEDQLWEVLVGVKGIVTFIYCTSSRPTTLEFREGEDPGLIRAVEERWNGIKARYDWVFWKMKEEGFAVVEYDWTKDSLEELVACLERNQKR